MQRHIRLPTAALVVSLLGGLSAPPLSAQTGTVTCESRGNDRQQCAIERNASVQLARQVSETPCSRGVNWGVGQGYIWVSGGCRAQFTVTRGAQVVVPPSNAAATPNQLRACRSEADRRLARYTYDEISVESESRQGSYATVRWWAGDAGGLCTVATTGRIIRFTMEGAGGGQHAAGRTSRLTCESKSGGREECRIPEGARVALVRQISQNPCRLNDTYGTGPGYLWVTKGCRAEFEVTERVGTGVSKPLPKPGVEAARSTKITCQSIGNTQQQCPIPRGATVRLVRERSSSACREHETWGTGPGFVWVNRGCAAEFEVSSPR